jgi:hypothetical protein
MRQYSGRMAAVSRRHDIGNLRFMDYFIDAPKKYLTKNIDTLQ